MKTMEEIIDLFRRQETAFENPMEPGCTVRDSIHLAARVRAAFDCHIPQRFLQLLMMHDGTEVNSLVVYATTRRRERISDIVGCDMMTTDLVEANISLRRQPGYERYLALAQREEEIYVHDVFNGMYIVIFESGPEPIRVWDTFDQLFWDAAEQSLVSDEDLAAQIATKTR